MFTYCLVNLALAMGQGHEGQVPAAPTPAEPTAPLVFNVPPKAWQSTGATALVQPPSAADTTTQVTKEPKRRALPAPFPSPPLPGSEWWKDTRGERSGYANTYTSNAIGWAHFFTPEILFRPDIGNYRAWNTRAFDLGTRKNLVMAGFDLTIRF
jgi:hypothetical protein